MKEIKDSLIHFRYNENKLELFLYVNNEDDEVPYDWHTSKTFEELGLFFTIDSIFESLFDDHWLHLPGRYAIHEEQKSHFMELKKQLEETLVKFDELEFITEEEFQEARQNINWKKISDEQIQEVIRSSEITLQNYCSDEKQMEFARAIEKQIREINK